MEDLEEPVLALPEHGPERKDLDAVVESILKRGHGWRRGEAAAYGTLRWRPDLTRDIVAGEIRPPAQRAVSRGFSPSPSVAAFEDALDDSVEIFALRPMLRQREDRLLEILHDS